MDVVFVWLKISAAMAEAVEEDPGHHQIVAALAPTVVARGK
jgi:hypothetical protein